MPELPDVEGFWRTAEKASGRRIERMAVLDRTLLLGGRASAVEGERFGEWVNSRTAVGRLSRRRVERLWRAMDEVVRESLPTERVPPAEGWLTGVRDRRDARCPRCGRPLRRGTVAGRTTVWCGRCQRS